jgi:hypothetical protein
MLQRESEADARLDSWAKDRRHARLIEEPRAEAEIETREGRAREQLRLDQRRAVREEGRVSDAIQARTGPARSFARRLVSLSSLLWLLPSLACAVTWLAYGRLSIGTDSLLRSGEISYMSPRESLVVFPMWIHDVWRSHLDDFCALAWWASLLAMVISSLRGPTEPMRSLGIRLLPLACALVVYFAMPYQAGVGVMLNVRLAPLLALFAVLPLRPAPGRWTTVPVAVVAAATIVMSVSSAVEIAACEREEIGDLDGLLARARPGSNVICPR